MLVVLVGVGGLNNVRLIYVFFLWLRGGLLEEKLNIGRG